MTNQELKKLNEDLWSAAKKMRADSDLKLNEIDTPILGLIFLKFADNKYTLVEKKIDAELKAQENSRRQRPVHEIAIEKCGFYLPRKARYSYLLNLPEEEDFAKAIKEAMDEIESFKPELEDVLPQDEYFPLARTDNSLLKALLKTFSDIPVTASGDIFGKIYEFFLGKFAMSEGQGGGEFYTPTSVVKYMVEVIEPHQGTVFDPACGSGGMFVQCSNFVNRRKQDTTDGKDLFVYGAEKTLATVKLAKMNIVVNGLRGSIKQANAYYEDPHEAFGKFDYIMANPPFNVKDVNYDKVKDDKRFSTYGIPQNKGAKTKKKKEGEVNLVPNGNYLWINLFATSLKPNGKAALVMPNSASDARHSERDIRETLIKKGLISQMVTLSSNMFSTVTLPASLWFFDKSNEVLDFETEKDNINILFVDARNVYRQIDRAHREFTQEQVWNLGIITSLYHKKEDRYTELVHQYIESVEGTFSNCLESYNAFTEAYDELAIGFSKWYLQADITKSQKKRADEEKLSDFVINHKKFEEETNYTKTYKTAQKALSSYIKKNSLTNKKQRELTEALTVFETEKKLVKKAFDKQFRTLEKLYKFAEKELRKKDDNVWKALLNLKNVRALLDNFIEHTNEQINREPVATDETEGKSSIYFLKQVQWLQEHFPEGKYEDVIGLCNVANYTEIEEQDFSLNSGRYVGVVIEEDGMTEEEFNDKIVELTSKLKSLHRASIETTESIAINIKELLGNE